MGKKSGHSKIRYEKEQMNPKAKRVQWIIHRVSGRVMLPDNNLGNGGGASGTIQQDHGTLTLR